VKNRKGYSKVEKRFPRESFYPLFYPRDPRDKKVEKNFPREIISFPPLNILFFPGQYFSAGLGNSYFRPYRNWKRWEAFFQLREILFSDPYPQVLCPRKLGHKNLRVRVRKVDFPGWKNASLLFQFLYMDENS
jgi:hypothetical protein